MWKREARMKCAHCKIHFHQAWMQSRVSVGGNPPHREIKTTVCPPCDGVTAAYENTSGKRYMDEPLGAYRGPVPSLVPASIASDYIEACNVLPISPKSSAALSRRCLQAMLRAHGYKAKDLAREVDMLLAETDSTKAIPQALRTVI